MIDNPDGPDVGHGRLPRQRDHPPRTNTSSPAPPHRTRAVSTSCVLLKTAALDAGVPLRDVQDAASHADPRTTMRYDRARHSLDRHATYIVAAFVAGASRTS